MPRSASFEREGCARDIDSSVRRRTIGLDALWRQRRLDLKKNRAI
jgi:hypothetical protein